MIKNLLEIIRKADKGNIDAMIDFVLDYDLKIDAENEPDIFERRFSYLNKLSENKFPYSYGSLAKYYYEGKLIKKDVSKAIKLYLEGAKYKNTDCCEALSLIYFSGEYKDLDKAYFYGNKAIEELEEYSTIKQKRQITHNYYSFIAYLCLAELFRYGLSVKKDIKKASDYYANACWPIIQGQSLESDYQAIASYHYALERLWGPKNIYGEDIKTEYKKNIVEAFDILDELIDWEFKNPSLLRVFKINIKDILDAHKKAKNEIKKLYKDAQYIIVKAGKYLIAKGEAENEVMDFADDLEALEYAASHHDNSNGGADESVKFILNTQTFETLYSE